VASGAAGVLAFAGPAGSSAALVVFTLVAAAYLTLPSWTTRLPQRKTRAEHA
jgi:hypothetical protein